MRNPTTKRLPVFRADECVLRVRKSRVRRGVANIRNAIWFAVARDIDRFSPHYTRINPATP
ncbi:hypothetical protein DF153_14430 [Burkholderia cenocepacia]|nr:hypothetical protein DF152_32990 [Burkholderia cenocepacia]RQU24720.1 hypothetical protein DF153_14430 [Burkholderia cenocepacia]